MRCMRATTIDGVIFPALLDSRGVLTDSRTGEGAKADKWEEITTAEYEELCDALGLE